MKSLTEDDFIRAAIVLGCDIAAVKAVAEVEAPRGGFNPDGSVVTLFEGHWFHTFTRGEYDDRYPEISYPRWDRTKYGGWQKEQARLQQAMRVDREAALKSASWGKFQIMGFNHHLCGFSNVEDMVFAMGQNEGYQLDAFVRFVQTKDLDDEMRALPDPAAAAGFARVYNGKGYKANDYDGKIIRSFLKHKG